MMRIVFVCVENSNRSQMAEGFARMIGGDKVDAYSAGSRPSGTISSKAIAAMAEKGVDIRGQQSKSLAELPIVEWDWVVTMGCGDACPHLPARNRSDWELPDPKEMDREAFNQVRDEIERRVTELLSVDLE